MVKIVKSRALPILAEYEQIISDIQSRGLQDLLFADSIKLAEILRSIWNGLYLQKLYIESIGKPYRQGNKTVELDSI